MLASLAPSICFNAMSKQGGFTCPIWTGYQFVLNVQRKEKAQKLHCCTSSNTHTLLYGSILYKFDSAQEAINLWDSTSVATALAKFTLLNKFKNFNEWNDFTCSEFHMKNPTTILMQQAVKPGIAETKCIEGQLVIQAALAKNAWRWKVETAYSGSGMHSQLTQRNFK